MNFKKSNISGVYSLKKNKKGKKKKHDEENAEIAAKALKKAHSLARCNHIDSVTGKRAFAKNDDGILVCKLCGREVYSEPDYLNEDAIKSAATLLNSVYGLMRSFKYCTKDIQDELIIAEKWNIAAHKIYEKWVYPNLENEKDGNKKKKDKKKKKKKNIYRLF